MKHLIIATLLFATAFGFAEEPEDYIIDKVDEDALHHGENLARITYSGNYVYLTGDHGEENDVVRNMPVLGGDFLETRYGSYAEVEFIDGSLLQLDNRTKLEFQAVNEYYGDNRLTIVKLHRGSVFLHVTESPRERLFRIDSVAGSAYVDLPGIYRVDLSGNRMKLKVFRGFAELSGTEDSAPIYSGEYATIHNMYRPSRVRPFNSFHGDRFERWAFDRRPVSDSVSAKYVDPEITSYSRDLDDHGEWRYDDGLSTHVWVPYVSVSWAPYNRGYWTSAGSAMTWVSYDAFGWVTHHYGRWGWSGGLGWYWIPGRYYSPAWVAWTTYDTYVGWCPLGFYNRPWYYRNRGRSTVVINNYYGNRWNYVRTEAIVRGRRNYENHRVVHRGQRRITTRQIYVNREDFSDRARFARVIREPEVNRRRIASRTVSRGTIVTRNASGRSRVAIADRATGTRAVSRNLSRRVVENRVKRDGGTRSEERNRSEFDTRSRGSSNVGETRRADTQRGYGTSNRSNSTVKRGSERSGRDSDSYRSRSGSKESKATRGSSNRSNNSRAVRGNDSRSNSNATRRAPSRSNESRATRGSSSGSNNSRATRSNSSGSNNSRATRSNSSGSNNSRATRSNSSGSNNSRATRSNSSGSNNSRATRSNSSRSNNSRATRSNSSGSNKPRATPSRSSGSKVSRGTATRKPTRDTRTRGN